MDNTSLDIKRTPDLIAAEINSIKNQTKKMVLYNSIEIGRRLIEAKELVPHGDWGEWLENSVEYSQRTAQNLMKIFNEYGSEQISLLGNNSKTQAFADLNYSQAVALLCIPEEEREQFIKDNDIDNMSTRELQQAIKEKQELEEKLKSAEKKAETEHDAYQQTSENYKKLQEINNEHCIRAEHLQKELHDIKKKLADAEASGDNKEIERLQNSLESKEKELNASNQKVLDLENQLKSKPIETTATIQDNKSIVKFSVYFDTLVKNFNDLLGALEDIKNTDESTFEKYKNATKGLISKMNERL